MWVILVLGLTTVLTGCSYIPFSGGALKGEVMPILENWDDVGRASIIQLETLPADPYSVKLWIAHATHLYVFGGDNHAQWAQNIDQDPHVRLQVDDYIYELAGARVLDEAEFKVFAQVWLDKYDSDRTDSSAHNTYLYRLTPRH